MKMNYETFSRQAMVILLCLLTFAGCGERRESKEANLFPHSDAQYVVVIVMDLSGSFSHAMANEGKAHKFSVQVIDRYFRRRDALNDRIVLAQISGTEQSLMWEGTPLKLRKDFPSAESFRDFLLEKADGGGSLVDQGVANAIDYVSSHERFTSGNTKSVTLILSDMEDTGGDPGSEQKLNQSLAAYGRQNGSVGIYFCGQLGVARWKDRLAQSGIRNYVVESEIVGEPNLPSFE